MDTYALPHDLQGEPDRLELMSRMLDPQLRFRLEQLGVGEGWRTLEVGAGNGSVSRWLSTRVGATGAVTVTDVDPDLIGSSDAANVTVRRLDVVHDELGSGYDLVLARALLHHIPERNAVIARLAAAVKPGGWLVLEEPDFHPCSRPTARHSGTSGRDGSRGRARRTSTTSSPDASRRPSSPSAWRTCGRGARRSCTRAVR